MERLNKVVCFIYINGSLFEFFIWLNKFMFIGKLKKKIIIGVGFGNGGDFRVFYIGLGKDV